MAACKAELWQAGKNWNGRVNGRKTRPAKADDLVE